jgi:hypothetical protein
MSRRTYNFKWTEFYCNFINRNIGIVSVDEQEQLRQSKVVVFGVGGLGGPLVEQIVRAGCEHIIICDNGKFEESNLNRQLCTINDIGKYKVDVISDLLHLINPNVEVSKIYEIEPRLNHLIKKVDVGVLTLDDLPLSILITRVCRTHNIPLLESWGIPYIWGFWFSKDSISYEQCYNFPTEHLIFEAIKNNSDLLTIMKEQQFTKLLQFPYIKEKYDREPGTVKELIEGTLPLVSFAPIVRMAASYLAFEVIFTGILKIKKMILAPKIIGFDLYTMHSFSL